MLSINKTLALMILGAAPAIGWAADAPLMGDRVATDEGDVIIHPIEHGTFAMSWNGKTIYVDPVGGKERFRSLPQPDLILITDVHGDHMDAGTLQAVAGKGTTIVAPPAVAEKLPRRMRNRVTPVPNGLSLLSLGLEIRAVPMYNLTPERLQYHSKGRGNGYVVIAGNRRFYISGDTEDIPEMRALRDIDVAFICMNLPYTMTVEQAASAIREFKPKIVYPYHYRGAGSMSAVEKLNELLAGESAIEVRLRQWYPQ